MFLFVGLTIIVTRLVKGGGTTMNQSKANIANGGMHGRVTMGKKKRRGYEEDDMKRKKGKKGKGMKKGKMM